MEAGGCQGTAGGGPCFEATIGAELHQSWLWEPCAVHCCHFSSLEVWGHTNHPQRPHRTPCSTLQHTRVTLVPLQLKPLPAMGSIDSKTERLPNHPAAAGGPRWRGGAATSAHSSQCWLLWCCEQLGRCCCWPSVIKVSLQPPLGWGGLESLA